MTRILAPSTQGFSTQKIRGTVAWGTPPSAAPSQFVGKEVTILFHYKGPTNQSDGVAATDYVRMISRLVPGGPTDCKNNLYRYTSDLALTVSLLSYPPGCSIPNGQCTVPGWMTDQVIQGAIAKMQGIEANILEDLGQLKQTGQLVADLFTTICTLYRDARKGFWWKVRRALREKGHNIPRHIANGWLMYFYGIKPLVATMSTLCQGGKPRIGNYRARSRVTVAVNPGNYTTAGYWVQWSGKAEVQAQCQVAARVRMSGDLDAWTKLGITEDSFTDAVVTAWALYPYSFVVDWIIPVEKFLRTRSWSPTLEYQGGFVGQRHEVAAQFTDDWPWSGKRYSGELPNGRLLVKFYRRETYPYQVPTSALNIRLTLNRNQMISAVALATK